MGHGPLIKPRASRPLLSGIYNPAFDVVGKALRLVTNLKFTMVRPVCLYVVSQLPVCQFM